MNSTVCCVSDAAVHICKKIVFVDSQEGLLSSRGGGGGGADILAPGLHHQVSAKSITHTHKTPQTNPKLTNIVNHLLLYECWKLAGWKLPCILHMETCVCDDHYGYCTFILKLLTLSFVRDFFFFLFTINCICIQHVQNPASICARILLG